MSFQTVLKSVGKDLSHVSGWIDDGLKIAEPIVGKIYPELGPILILLEDVFGKFTPSTTINSSQLQQLITSVATTQALKSAATVTSTSSEIGLITLAEKLNSLLTTPSK